MTVPRPLRARAKRAWSTARAVVTTTYTEWRGHRTIRYGAALAYYGLFAIVPLLSVSLAVAGLVVSEEAVSDYLVEGLEDLFGPAGNALATELAAQITRGANVAGLGLVGFASLVVAASLLFLALQDAFNMIWEVPVRVGVRHSVLRRLFAFGIVLATGAALVLAFALNAVTSLLSTIVPGVTGIGIPELFGLAGSWALGIGVLALVLRYLTEAEVPWRPALIGGVVTAFAVSVGNAAIGAYLRRYTSSSLVGATGTVALLLLWIYYQSQILLVGAEFTRVLTLRRAAPSS